MNRTNVSQLTQSSGYDTERLLLASKLGNNSILLILQAHQYLTIFCIPIERDVHTDKM
jgi:hypothetical protein